MTNSHLASGLTLFLSELIIAIKSANTQWMENNLDNIYKNRLKKELLELDIEEEIKSRKVDIQKKLDKKSIENEAELQRLRMKCDQDTKNYEDFLRELEKMKAKIIQTFESIPPTMALLIHRHASELLNEMWNEKKIDKRRTLENRLFHLFDTVTDDVRSLETSQDGEYDRPEKTISLIMGKEN